jgi:hypothetical protein
LLKTDLAAPFGIFRWISFHCWNDLQYFPVTPRTTEAGEGGDRMQIASTTRVVPLDEIGKGG